MNLVTPLGQRHIDRNQFKPRRILMGLGVMRAIVIHLATNSTRVAIVARRWPSRSHRRQTVALTHWSWPLFAPEHVRVHRLAKRQLRSHTDDDCLHHHYLLLSMLVVIALPLIVLLVNFVSIILQISDVASTSKTKSKFLSACAWRT